MRLLYMAVLLFTGIANAQTVHVCEKGGKKIMSDSPCDTFGAETKQIRPPTSYQPLTVIGGVTPGERRMSDEYKARDQIEDQQRAQQAAQRRATAQAEEQANVQICAQLDNEKRQIVAQLRMNSTPWLNDRHREVNDEMYRRRCKTL